jgi:hypothetical protein
VDIQHGVQGGLSWRSLGLYDCASVLPGHASCLGPEEFDNVAVTLAWFSSQSYPQIGYMVKGLHANAFRPLHREDQRRKPQEWDIRSTTTLRTGCFS